MQFDHPFIMKILSIFLSFFFGFQFMNGQTAEQGLTTLQTGQYARAAVIFEKLATSQPSDVNIQLLLSEAYLSLGKTEESKAVLQKINPDSPLGQVALGRLLLLNKNLPEAKAAIAKAVNTSREKDVVVLRQAGASFTLFKIEPETATLYLEKAKDLDPKNFETIMALGDAYQAGKKYGDAVNQYEFANILRPKSPAPYYRAGKILQAAENHDLFVEKMNQALSVDAAFCPAMRELGDFFYRQGSFTEARDFYDQYLATEPSPTVEDRMQFANILFLSKDYQQVIPVVEEILQMDASRNYLRRLIGYSYFETGENAKSLVFMQDFLKNSDPAKIIASDYQYLGMAFSKAGQDSLSSVNFEKALQLDGSNSVLLAKVAEVKFRQNKFSEAAGFYAKLIEVTDPTAQDYFNLGKACFFAKDYVRADSAFTQITRIKPEAATGWLWRAKANARLEPDVVADSSAVAHYGIAKPFFEKYVTIVTASPDISKYKKDLIDAYNYLASYHYLKGEKEQAGAFCEKTLLLEPADKYALEMKKSLF